MVSDGSFWSQVFNLALKYLKFIEYKLFLNHSKNTYYSIKTKKTLHNKYKCAYSDNLFNKFKYQILLVDITKNN